MAKNDDSVAFLAPGQDQGFRPVLRAPDIQPEYHEAAFLGAVVSSQNEAQTQDLHRFIRNYREFKSAKRCVVFKSFPVVVKDFDYRGKIPKVGDRIVLTGASALRVRMKLAKLRTAEEVEADISAQRQSRDDAAANGLIRRSNMNDANRHLPFVIECRNFFNFYHFTTESLIYLQMYRDHDMRGEICMITSGQHEVRKFIKKSIKDFYPDLLDRVKFLAGNVSFDRAIIPFNTNHLYHQAADSLIEDIELKGGFSHIKKDGALRPATIDNYKFIYNNSRDEYIDRHRASVLADAPVAGGKRLYVGRKPGAGKERSLVGEATLKQMLARYGFENTYLEDHSPKQQAHLCHSADVFLSAHGAGFANMMYARPGAFFVELSHLQTARHRFGDFNMHAAVSGAKYIHFFADHSTGQGDDVPSMDEDGHSGIALSDAALDRLEGLVAIIVDVPAYRIFIRAISQMLKKGRPQEALSLLQQHPAYALGCARTLMIASDACKQLGDPEGAMAHLTKALEIAPFRSDLRQHKRDLAQEMGRADIFAAESRARKQFEAFRWMRWEQDVSGATLIQHRVKV